jgi:hypothetical protein
VGQFDLVRRSEFQEFPKAVSSIEEFHVSIGLLPAIRRRYCSSFKLLEIPEVLRSEGGVGRLAVYFRNYDGERYNERWNEGNGGAPLGTEVSAEMVQIIKDLRQIDVDWLLSVHPVGEKVRQSAFDLQVWLSSFQKCKTQALSLGISDSECTQAGEFIRSGFQLTRRIVSNGDFYPRNLIKTPTRMVLVDWGYWQGHRACFVDYLVNVAAFAYIHMWGNGLWQREFVRLLRETLDIQLDDLRKAVLIKSFEQAMFWINLPQLAQVQVTLFKTALNSRMSA